MPFDYFAFLPAAWERYDKVAAEKAKAEQRKASARKSRGRK